MTRGLLADCIPSSCVDGPGNRFVVFTQGCTFNCLACHNPQTIARRAVAASHWVEVDDLIGQIGDAAPFISGVTASGGEATCQSDFVAELFGRIKSDPRLGHLTTLIDTNGDAGPEVWDRLDPVLDGAMVDLKALDPDLHRLLARRSNQRVLDSITRLAGHGKLYEVRLLLIPGINDGADQLTRTAAWLLQAAPEARIRLNGFRRHGVRRAARSFTQATGASLMAAAGVLMAAGVRAERIFWIDV